MRNLSELCRKPIIFNLDSTTSSTASLIISPASIQIRHKPWPCPFHPPRLHHALVHQQVATRVAHCEPDTVAIEGSDSSAWRAMHCCQLRTRLHGVQVRARLRGCHLRYSLHRLPVCHQLCRCCLCRVLQWVPVRFGMHRSRLRTRGDWRRVSYRVCRGRLRAQLCGHELRDQLHWGRLCARVRG